MRTIVIEAAEADCVSYMQSSWQYTPFDQVDNRFHPDNHNNKIAVIFGDY